LDWTIKRKVIIAGLFLSTLLIIVTSLIGYYDTTRFSFCTSQDRFIDATKHRLSELRTEVCHIDLKCYLANLEGHPDFQDASLVSWTKMDSLITIIRSEFVKYSVPPDELDNIDSLLKEKRMVFWKIMELLKAQNVEPIDKTAMLKSYNKLTEEQELIWLSTYNKILSLEKQIHAELDTAFRRFHIAIYIGASLFVIIFIIVLYLLYSEIVSTRKTEENLKASELMFRSVTESSHSGVCIANSKGEFILINHCCPK